MKTKLFFIGRLVLLLWGGIVPFLSFSQQIPKSLTAANGTFIGFWEYKPVDYAANPTKKYPVIIFLHGLGERGNGTTDLPNVLSIAIPKYIAAGHTMTFTYNGQTETFLVLSPQLRGDLWDWPAFYTEEMIRYAKNNLNIDTNRIYVTGVSLGGGGAWRYASASYENARTVAAIAPVCGTCGWSNVCGTIAAANLPVWAFHAQDDGVVGYGCTVGAIANINSCNPAVPAIQSIYPTGNHWIWDMSYDTAHNFHNPNMYEWFLSKSRAGTTPGPNVPPIARAGNDQTITLPTNSVTLNGTLSSDPDGTISAFSWTKIGGPSQHTIVSPAGTTTVVNNLAQGTYSFELTVTDNRGASAKDTVLVTVNGAAPAPNQPPVALAGTDQTLTLPNSNTYLFGSGSYDPDGIITNYSWSQVNGPNAASITILSASNVNVSNLVQGVYNFRLVVTDNNSGTAADTLRVTVLATNVPPVANAGVDQSIQLPTNSVTLNGSASTDPDGTITAYVWSKIAGPTQYNIATPGSVTTAVNNLAAGTYSFRLLITDSRGESDDDTVVITVAAPPPPPNIAPTANAGSDQSIQLPTSSVTLNGAASSDADGTITAYAWSKIAGPAQYNISNGNTVSASASNLAAGTYSFRLVVTDNSGATDADTVVITVAPAPPPPNVAPVANAGADQSIQLPVNSAALNGSGSSDADGTVTGYAWSKIAGPSQYNISNSNTVSPSVTNLVSGTYSFRLVVTDNSGATDDDTVVITVTPAPNVAPTANAGGDQSIQLPTNNATLNGSASSDADGTIVSYSWSKVSGPAQYNISNAGNVSTSVTNLAAGTYLFRLGVTDNDGASDDDTVMIIVGAAPPPPNTPPVANAGNDQSIQLPTNSIALDGSASADNDGTITAYAWSKISGPTQYNIANSNSVNTSITNLAAGTYSFRLVVTDNNGATDDDTVVVTVTSAPPPPNIAPSANAGSDQSIQLPTNNVTLNGSA
ncbi:MAG: PKD domain-containing protein, partial [Chitinophagaceae bacterium]